MLVVRVLLPSFTRAITLQSGNIFSNPFINYDNLLSSNQAAIALIASRYTSEKVCQAYRQAKSNMPFFFKVQIFLLVDLREKKSDLGSGGRKKKKKKSSENDQSIIKK